MTDIINKNNLITIEKIINKNFKKEDIINQIVKVRMKFLFPKKGIKTEKIILIMYMVITLMMTMMMKLMIMINLLLLLLLL